MTIDTSNIDSLRDERAPRAVVEDRAAWRRWVAHYELQRAARLVAAGRLDRAALATHRAQLWSQNDENPTRAAA